MKNRIIVVGMVLAWTGAALGACGDSTSPGPRPPAAPTNLAATSSSASEIALTWQDNSDNEASFVIERCAGVGCTSFADLATVGANTTGYHDQGLTVGTSYSYRVCAHNAGGDSYYSNTAVATTSVTAPAAPSNLVATASSTTRIGLTWQDNSSNEDNFVLERCTGATCTTFTPIATLPANTTSHQDQGLAPVTTYRYRVRAHSAGGDSEYSDTASATTGMTPPAAPSNLVATAASTTQIDLTWQDNSSDEDNFILERCTGATCTPSTPVATLPANTSSYWDQGLTPATTYRYRVRAHNAGGNSEPSNVAVAATRTTPPAAPTNLQATATSASQIHLTWQDHSNDETGFAVERCTGDGCPDFTRIATSPANATSYDDSGISGVTYTYRVQAFNDGGYSNYSNTATATIDLTTPPAAPTGLVAAPTSASEIALTWQDNSDNEELFSVERCTGAGCEDFTEIGLLGANATSYRDRGLIGGTYTYRYRVRASNAAGYSDYSSPATVTIDVSVAPAAPSNMRAYIYCYTYFPRGACSYVIQLAWQDNSDNEESFALEACSGEGCTLTQVRTLPANTTGLRYGSYSTGTSYSFRIRAYNAAGYSNYSNTATLTPIAAPTNLVAAPISTSQIALTWQDNSSNEGYFAIERCTGVGCVRFTQIRTVAANTSSYQDQGLTGGTSYSYRVRAQSASGISSYSNTATATTP
jgi:predicted phage tail protein